jgi:asparagine synthase (glutamine-hydrolysing)
MAGIAGVVSQCELGSDHLVKNMAQSLCMQPKSKPEFWQGAKAGLCRVQIGFDNPEPQPIFSRDRKKCIVMFGECFGHEEKKKELIRRGQTFDFSANDAEFCLRLYEEYGEKQFDQLSGSFCFAIYDTEKGDLLLVNDRLSTRPLFYGTTPDGTLIFSTQVSSILLSPEIDRELNLAAVLEFCTLQRVLGEKTYHAGIQMLPPASVLRHHAGKSTVSPYWEPLYRPQPGSADEYAEELAAVMKRSSRHLARGNAKVAMLLSGGLDARMIVAAAENELTCYSFGDYENPEVQTARRIAEAKGFEFHFLKRNPDHYPNLVEKAVEIGNGMHPFNHAHAIGFIDHISQKSDVITHGYVPELMFRGTSLPKVDHSILGISLGEKLDPTLNESNLGQRILKRGYSLLGKGGEQLFTPEAASALQEVLKAEAREMVAQAAPHSSNIYDQFLWPDIHYHARYPSMLFETSLRPFMTERSLFFNNEVIDLHLRMPVHIRSDNRVWLKAVSKLDKKVARVVDANTGYPPTFPVAVASGIKAGKKLLADLPMLWKLQRKGQDQRPGLSPISWPRFDWLVRNNPELRKIITDTLSDPEALPPHIFDLQQVKRVLDEHLADHGQNRIILFTLLTFGRWHKKHANK